MLKQVFFKNFGTALAFSQKFDHFVVNKSNSQIDKLSNNSKIPNTTNRDTRLILVFTPVHHGVIVEQPPAPGVVS